jgi:hypothetical protein
VEATFDHSAHRNHPKFGGFDRSWPGRDLFTPRSLASRSQYRPHLRTPAPHHLHFESSSDGITRQKLRSSSSFRNTFLSPSRLSQSTTAISPYDSQPDPKTQITARSSSLLRFSSDCRLPLLDDLVTHQYGERLRFVHS